MHNEKKKKVRKNGLEILEQGYISNKIPDELVTKLINGDVLADQVQLKIHWIDFLVSVSL